MSDPFSDDPPPIPPAKYQPRQRHRLDIDALTDEYIHTEAHTNFILSGCLAYNPQDSDTERPWLNKGWAWWAFRYASATTLQRIREVFLLRVGFELDSGPITWSGVTEDYERLPAQYVNRKKPI